MTTVFIFESFMVETTKLFQYYFFIQSPAQSELRITNNNSNNNNNNNNGIPGAISHRTSYFFHS